MNLPTMDLSSISKIDTHCLVAAILFVLSDLIAIIGFFLAANNHTQFEFSQLLNLDPTFIQKEWEWMNQYFGINLTHELLNAFAWFVLAMPIIKVAWIQSNGGTRMMGLHISIIVMALAGSFSELISRLLALGVNNALGWMAGSFNLDDWGTNTSSDGSSTEPDMIGWRTLEMIDIATSGLLLWIDSIEFLFLSVILILFLISIKKDNELFSMRWAKYGRIMAILSIIEFVTAILRFKSWGIFSSIGYLINVVNQLFLFPIWLIWLGKQLPAAERATTDRLLAGRKPPESTISEDSTIT